MIKTRRDLYELALHDPVVSKYLQLVDCQALTPEQALIGMVFTLRDQKNAYVEKHIDHLNRCRGVYK